MSHKIISYIEKYDNVVWDWNGTLLNDIEVILKSEALLLPKYGIAVPSLEQRSQLFCFPIKKYYERLGFDFTQYTFESVNDEFMNYYEEVMNETPLFEGVHEMLREVKSMGKAQYILSAASQDHLLKTLKDKGVYEHFDAVFGLPNKSADSKLQRGRELLEFAKIEPSRTLMIGDTSHDYEVGSSLGFDVLLVADGHKPYEELLALHDQVLKTRY